MARLRFCFGLVLFNGLVLLAATGARAQQAGSPGCQGVVCDIAPGSGGAPITSADAQAMRAAEEERARKVAADFDNQKPDAEEAGLRRKHKRAEHTARHAAKPAHVAEKAERPVAQDKAGVRSGLSSYETKPAPSRAVASAERPIAIIFGLAPRTANPYATGFRPWLTRLSWPQESARPQGSVVFAVQGYRDPATAAPEADGMPVTAAEAERLSIERRATALSIQGFDTLKADLPRS